AYTYTVTSEWMPFFQQADVAQYFTVGTNGLATAVEGLASDSVAMRAFSKLASAYAEAHPELTTIGDPIKSDADGSSVSATNLEDGYYLITSTLGTLAVVESTPVDPDRVIEEKNEEPSLDKQVQEDSKVGKADEWGDENDADVGQTVNFKSTIIAKSGAKNYVMHDKMEKGLSLNANSVVVEGLTKGKDYTVVTSDLDDGCTFHVVFAKSFLDSITVDKNNMELVVKYSAVLTADAIAEGALEDGIKNDAKLTYGDHNETEWDETITKTHDLSLLKYDGADSEKKPLAGAEFGIKRASDSQFMSLVKIDDNTYRIARTSDATADRVTSFTTNSNQEIKIVGLDSDKYILTEINAPSGYNILVEDTEVTISNDETVVTVEVANNTGAELPSTGGIGTTIFYVVGAILVVGAAVILIAKRRVKATEA
ncbi:MAG: SpaH/EbpB family LPXTG-anchored major pilin, partial [Ruminococcus sp.]|nr:SpaH/EbpB family LPXTG-anchored major pilin [Ruminococcus sp.]